MYEHVKTGCKHISPSEQPLQFQSRYFLNKPRVIFHRLSLFYYDVTPQSFFRNFSICHNTGCHTKEETFLLTTVTNQSQP